MLECDKWDIVKKCVNVMDLLDSYNIEYTRDEDVCRCCCPIHGGHNSNAFVFNIKTKKYKCYTQGCEGDVYDFIELMEEAKRKKIKLSYFCDLVCGLDEYEIGIEGLENNERRILVTIRGLSENLVMKFFKLMKINVNLEDYD